MRILFIPLPAIGHAFPMVPLAWALRNAGHEVTFLAGLGAVEVRNAGLPVVDAESEADAFSRKLTGNPELFTSAAHLTAAERAALQPAAVRVWDGPHDHVVAQAKRCAPDLVVVDPVYNAGYVAAAVLGVPAVSHNYALTRYSPELVRANAPEAFEHHGVDLPARTAQLDVGPAGLMGPGKSDWQMRYIPYNGGGLLPPWLFEPPGAPRIAISLGVPLPHRSGADRFTHILDAAAETRAEFALTMNAEAASRLGVLPPNVRVVGWLPLYQLLRTCTAIVHHGGPGTMFSAIAAGIPQLVVPDGADYHFNAEALHDYGCGLTCASGQVDADLLTTLAHDVRLRAAAQRLREDMERLPTPSDLVGEIVDFARPRPQRRTVP
ncbi:nucleotide disphospho-sugar-binding domain-containing protein [Actinosynnema sp. CS-041913]|uniref:nucleotide disphospho-sugar-binding domain-containing protein n=1 Tax=Actinosynnema sp. CS-041913 TaxID=3239917 RepID=UPI003D912A7D